MKARHAILIVFSLSIVWTITFQTPWHVTWIDTTASIDDILASGPFLQMQSALRPGEDSLITSLKKRNQNSSKAMGTKEAGIELKNIFTNMDDRNTTVIKSHEKQKSCKCVDCKRDALCGKLWNGNQVFGKVERKTAIYKKEIHLVVSHCKTDLDFIEKFTEGFKIASVHVISKCGHPVNGAPHNATIQVLPNVGRCDHTYAYYITNVLDQKLLHIDTQDNNGEDAVVVFLKDTRHAGANNLHQPGSWNSFYNMVQVASSRSGFACGILPGRSKEFRKYTMSAYFELETLRKFRKTAYKSRAKYHSDNVPFESALDSWELFYKNLGAGSLETELVRVCFGGIFAASVQSIKRTKMEVWRAAEQSLSRGNNIQEGHYMERIWATLLALPLEEYQVEALKNYSDFVFRPGYGGNEALIGALAKRIKKNPVAVVTEQKKKQRS
jgi:hypothetical protein